MHDEETKLSLTDCLKYGVVLAVIMSAMLAALSAVPERFRGNQVDPERIAIEASWAR